MRKWTTQLQILWVKSQIIQSHSETQHSLREGLVKTSTGRPLVPTDQTVTTLWGAHFQQSNKQATKVCDVHMSKVNEITSRHLISASFCTPIGVCRSDTWKFSTSMSEAPNVASTLTFSYMWNWTFLLAIDRRHRRKLSLSFARACCSFCSCSAVASEATEVGMEVRQRAMKRGDFGSNPRLLGSGPFGRRSTDTGFSILSPSAKTYCKKSINKNTNIKTLIRLLIDM